MRDSSSPPISIVTGATSGIGKVTALELARLGHHVFLTARTLEKGQPVRDEICAATKNDQVDVIAVDFADLGQVQRAAHAWLARGLPLHLLVNNAGLAGQRGQTADGFELTFGVNHLGHFLWTRLLEERLVASAPARIVNVSSAAHYQAKQGIVFDALQQRTPSTTGMAEYAVSKLANVLFTVEHARRLANTGVTTYALHPGVVATDVWRRVPSWLAGVAKRFMLSPEDGAKTTLYCATAPDLAEETGGYYERCAPKRPSRCARDADLAQRLWAQSEVWVAPWLAQADTK